MVRTFELDERKIIATKMKDLRLKEGWTQNQLAELIGVSFQTIQKYENEEELVKKLQNVLSEKDIKRRKPDLTKIKKLIGYKQMSDFKQSLIKVIKNWKENNERN